jgi:hypothetical protein
MRSFALFTLALASHVAASPVGNDVSKSKFPNLTMILEKRQAPKGIEAILGALGNMIPKIKAIKIQTLTPTFPGDDVKRVALTYGPFKLKAANSKKKEGNFFSLDPQGTSWINVAKDFPTDITILNSHFSIHFQDGTLISNANGVYDHHAFVIDSSKAPEAHIGCAGSKIPIMPVPSLMGSSAEAMDDTAQGGVNLKIRPTTGNYIGKGHTIVLQGDLVNYNNKTEEVYMTAEMSYVDGREKGIWEISTHLVPVGICGVQKGGLAALAPPPNVKKWTLKDDGLEMKDNGKLMYVRGHMHGKSSITTHMPISYKWLQTAALTWCSISTEKRFAILAQRTMLSLSDLLQPLVLATATVVWAKA